MYMLNTKKGITSTLKIQKSPYERIKNYAGLKLLSSTKKKTSLPVS